MGPETAEDWKTCSSSTITAAVRPHAGCEPASALGQISGTAILPIAAAVLHGCNCTPVSAIPREANPCLTPALRAQI